MEWRMATQALVTCGGLGLSAAACEYAVPLWSLALGGLGDALPAPTALLVAAVSLHLPALLALLGSLAVLVLLARGSRWLGDLCLALLFLSALLPALAAWAMALPIDACGMCAVIGDGP